MIVTSVSVKVEDLNIPKMVKRFAQIRQRNVSKPFEESLARWITRQYFLGY